MNHSLPYKLDGIVTDSDGEPNNIRFAVMFFVLLSGLLSGLFSVFVVEFVSMFFDVFGVLECFFGIGFSFIRMSCSVKKIGSEVIFYVFS